MPSVAEMQTHSNIARIARATEKIAATLEPQIDDDLKAIIKAALEGESNDAEHEALCAVADALDIEWSDFDDLNP